jgi:hypothetical protein
MNGYSVACGDHYETGDRLEMAGNVGRVLAANVEGSRSYWYRWLAKNRAEITAVFASQRRPSWMLLVKTATEIGAVDENGNPPTREGLRKAWERLQRDRPDAALSINKAARRKSAGTPQSVASPPSEVPAAVPAPGAGDDDDPPPRASRYVFKPGRPKF